MSRLEELVIQLKGLINIFSENRSDGETEKTTEKLMRILEDFRNTVFDKSRDSIHLAKINSCAIALWNISVALRSGKKTNNIINAKARHVACHLTFLASDSEMTESSWRRKLPLALKTGKAWLDCKNPEMAEKCFKLASQCWAKIELIRNSKLTNEQPTLKGEQQIQECELSMIKLYAYRAEVAFTFENDEAAKQFMDEAKQLLVKLPKQGSFLATFCYNFGVESFQNSAYEKSISWLRESYEIGKGIGGEMASSQKTQATCLRLIANAYLEIGGKENATLAMNSVDLSIAEEANPRSLYLKLKITLQNGDSQQPQAMSVLEDCVSHPDLKIDLGIQIFKLVAQQQCDSLVVKALDCLTKRFQKSHETTKFQTEYLGYLLEANKHTAAKDLIQSTLISGVKQLPQSNASFVKKFHILMWAQAAKLFEAESYEDSLTWYEFSLDCFGNSSQEIKDIAKLQRNRASCLLGMKQYEQAVTAVGEAYKLEGDSVQNCFLHFKISLASTDDEKAVSCIEKLSELALQESDPEFVHGFVCLAAQMAFQDGNKEVAVSALEKVVQQAKDPKQILTSLRCLTRLRYTYLSPFNQSEEIKKMLSFVRKAYQTLKTESLPKFESEVQWFVKIAWNLGLTCQNSYPEMHQFFVLCFELSLFMQDACNKTQQKTCLLMAASSGIEAAKLLTDVNEKACILKDVLSYIQKCEKIYQEIIKGNAIKEKEDPTLGMLVCLEFEAKSLLGYANLDVIFDKAMALPNANEKVYETIAAMALNISHKYKQVGIKALRTAIKLRLDNDDIDYFQLSKDLHTLVTVSIQEGGTSNAQSKEEAFQYYHDILEILQKAPTNAYPEMETLWLMTKAWNCGVYLYSAHEFEECEKWCGMAMKLLDQLDLLKSSYSSHMTTVFADMLGRRERISVRNQSEE